MAFKPTVGMKVRCLDDDQGAALLIIVGQEYIVAEIDPVRTLRLEGIPKKWWNWNRFEEVKSSSSSGVKWVKCIDPHQDGQLIKGQVYQVRIEDDDMYYIVGSPTGYSKARFQTVDPPHLAVRKTATSSTSTVVDPDEDRLWKIMRPRLNQGDCPCGGRRGVCKYHP